MKFCISSFHERFVLILHYKGKIFRVSYQSPQLVEHTACIIHELLKKTTYMDRFLSKDDSAPAGQSGA